MFSAMAGLLAREIHQTRPFASPAMEAYLALIRTAEVLARDVATALRAYDLTHAQYNILRILRGAAPQGLTCGTIAERLVTLDPDVTRLLDKLETRGLVTRERQVADRRVVIVRITAPGDAVCNHPGLCATLGTIHERRFAALGPQQTATLIDLLENLRAPARGVADDTPTDAVPLTGSPAAVAPT